MADNAPCHFYANLKIYKFFKFSDVRFPPPPPCTLITVYGSHTWATRELTCMRTVPSTFQKIVAEKPSVNHIGSSTSHQLRQKGDLKEKVSTGKT